MMTQQEEVMPLTEQHLEALEAELKKSWVERDHDYVSDSVLGLLATISHWQSRAGEAERERDEARRRCMDILDAVEQGTFPHERR